jgi:hypothetical protein
VVRVDGGPGARQGARAERLRIPYHLAVNASSSFDCARAVELLDASLVLQSETPMRSRSSCNASGCRRPGKAGQVLARIGGDAAVVQGLKGMQALYQRDYAQASQWFRKAIAADNWTTQTDSAFDGYLPASVDWQLQLALSEQRAGAAERRARPTGREGEGYAGSRWQTRSRYIESGWHLALGLALAGLGESEAAAYARQHGRRHDA